MIVYLLNWRGRASGWSKDPPKPFHIYFYPNLPPAGVPRRLRTLTLVMKDATICERQEIRGQAEVPSRDGAGSATVRLAIGEAKKELFAVKGRTRRTRLPRTLRSRRITKVRSRTDSRSCTAVRKERDYFSGEPGSLAM